MAKSPEKHKDPRKNDKNSKDPNKKKYEKTYTHTKSNKENGTELTHKSMTFKTITFWDSGSKPEKDAKELSIDDLRVRSYESAFELTGEGCFNYIALVSSSFIFIHSLLEMIAIAYVLDPMECELHLTVSQKTLVGSAIFMGVIGTAIFWGALGDTYGRRKVMLPAIFLTVAASIGSSFCTAFWSMFLMRLITGCLVSASSATILVYLGELNTSHYRDRNISYALTAVSASFCLTPIIAWGIIPGKWSMNLFGMEIKPWRVYMWIFSIFGLIGGIILIFLPESPSFVVTHRGSTEAIRILNKMYHYNHLRHPTKFPVIHLKHTEMVDTSESAVKRAFRDMKQLFKAPIRRPFLITHYCMFMVFLLANGVYLWMPGIFTLALKDITLPWNICKAMKSRYEPQNDFIMEPHMLTRFHGAGGLEDDGLGCTPIDTMMYPMAFIMEVILLVPFTIITIIINKFNKCKLYAAVMIPCSVGLATCVMVPQVLVASILITIGICSGSAASLLTSLAVEAFPTSLRALVMCTMYMMGQVGSIVGNSFMGLAASGQCEVVIIFLAVLNVGSCLSILFLWPDLKEVRRIMEERHFAY